MNKRFSLFFAAGAGLALAAVMDQRRRQEHAAQWARRASRTAAGVVAITGASSGIGAAFARALASEGHDLLLIARREDRLRALAEEIQRDRPITVEVLSADLSVPEDIERAAARLSEIPNLELFVNNAGFGASGKFAAADPQVDQRMIHVHVAAAVRLTRAVLPGMIERGHGGVINVSSIAGLMPMPGNITYGSTKSYLNFFSEALHLELRGTGVRVQALCPGFTWSEFHDVANEDRSVIPSFLWMQPEPVVEESLRGLREDRVIVVPGLVYRMIAWVMRLPLVKPLARKVQEIRLENQRRR